MIPTVDDVRGYIKQNPGCRGGGIAVHFGCHKDTVSKRLKVLRDAGETYEEWGGKSKGRVWIDKFEGERIVVRPPKLRKRDGIKIKDKILEVLTGEPMHIDDLSEKVGANKGAVTPELRELIMDNFVLRTARGYYAKNVLPRVLISRPWTTGLLA